MNKLELMRFPLDRHALIEASAGTGKTYALANLYLRYLLERACSPEQILVVTFTEAATQELRDRIRQRIRDLIRAFETGHSDDHLLADMLASSADPGADKIRLRMAERQMDLAEIHTIHGFCQRLLGQFALDLKVPLQQHLEQDLRPLLLQAMEDFWRTRLRGYSIAQQDFIVQRWPTPERLLEALAKMLNRTPERLLPDVSDDRAWQSAFEEQEKWVAVLKQRTLQDAEAVEAVLSSSHLKSLKHRLNWFASITSWAEDSAALTLPHRGNQKRILFADFLPHELIAQTKKGQSHPEHDYFQFLDTHFARQLPDLDAMFLVCAYHWLRQRFDTQKQRKGLIGFDDLIAQVDAALSIKGAEGERISERVAGPYQVALIDEFQDTDPAQYRIFTRLFMTQSDRRMVLIGDPKQAIYGFRGGDIATYLQARRQMESHQLGEIYTMDTNWRSSPNMVAAVNALFAGHPTPFQHTDISFHPVQAAKSPGHNAPGAALYVSLVPAEGLAKDALNDTLARIAVAQIQALLKEYNSADIAVLVRAAHEAELMQAALAEQGIRASFEGRQHIFESAEASSLYFLLAAVAEPEDEGQMRRCLSDALLGLNDAEFARMREDPHFHAMQQDIFFQLQRVWQEQGVLAMVRRAMHHYLRVPRGDDAASRQAWERCLSNFNQLAELLQQQAQKAQGFSALTRYLYFQIHNPGQVDDVNRLRLESDESLVRIVTIHKSKGLEYPIVLVPFLYSARGAEDAWFYDDDGRLTLDLCASEASLLRAEQERIAEDMRLLYVALTRARYRCLVGTASYAGYGSALGWWQTAWGQIVTGGQVASGKGHKPEPELLMQGLAQLAQGRAESIGYRVYDKENLSQSSVLDAAGVPAAYDLHRPLSYLEEALPQARNMPALWPARWQVQSFTRLLHLHQSRTADEAGMLPPITRLPSSPGISIHQFPRGASAGTFLHQVFEAIALESGELNEHLRLHYDSLHAYIAEQLQRYQLVPGDQLEQWSGYLCKWVDDMRRTPLWSGFSLSALAKEDYRVELSFDFSVNDWPVARFNALCQKYYPDLPHWQFDDFEGLVTGAIDLLVRHDGQYFVLDYKSNYLGEDASFYHAEALEETMLHHGYHLQYLVYCLAVHRFLKQRLGERYDYALHVGGVAYLFLRGMDRASSGVSEKGDRRAQAGVYFTCPPKGFIESFDAMLIECDAGVSGGHS